MWAILGVETFFFALLAIWILSRLERLFAPTALLVALAIIVMGDLITALVMQRYTRPDIMVSPGETADSRGWVISGFGGDTLGRVSVRGEQWKAVTDVSYRLAPGDPVRVVARSGLTLTVKPLD